MAEIEANPKSGVDKNSQAVGDEKAGKLGEEAAAQLFERHSKSVVRINDYLGPIALFNGSGFFVQGDQDCLIATTRHVANGDRAWVTTSDGKEHKAKAELLDDKHEISIYSLDREEMARVGTVCPALKVSSDKPQAGEPVLSMGAAGTWSEDKDFRYRWRFNEVTAERPGYVKGAIEGELSRGKFWTWSTWINNGFYHHGDLKDRLVKASDVNVPGYSGGPWINKSGEVIGITYGTKKYWFAANSGIAESAQFLGQDLERLRLARQVLGKELKLPVRAE